ncbi:MAG TPA: serine/threonine-protein kinase [Candidatus Dormibacteraeota bacterium]|nr:serine/threonine-protein kinase [Candidatus Dormibacteraeota bacterium]
MASAKHWYSGRIDRLKFRWVLSGIGRSGVCPHEAWRQNGSGTIHRVSGIPSSYSFLFEMVTITKAGRYEIQSELGRGAMGVVYKAVDPVIGRTVAVKTLRLSEEGTGLSRPELLNRFQTEARAAGLLTHPNIVVVFDAGEEDGLYYITMELVEGKSLQGLLDAGQAFPLARVLRIMEQTCSALQFAHERNIVHRDIKPANLMLTADDTVKVTDFGTAKILQFGTVQQTAHVMGTPSYMSPEQVKGRVVDGRSDIFSLGVMLYEMVTGEKPFPGQNITTVIYKIVNEDPVPPRTIDPSIHAGLSAVIMKALAKEPSARYQTCKEMLEDLKNYRSLSAMESPTSTVAMSGSPDATIATSKSLLPRPDELQAAHTARSLQARAATPSQTPAIRRTGVIQPPEPERKSSPIWSILLGLILVGVIVYGYRKIKPVFDDARQQNQIQRSTPGGQDPQSTQPDNGSSPAGTTPDNSEPPAIANPAPERKPETAASKFPAANASGGNTGLTPVAAEYKGRIEEAASEKRIGGKLKIHGTGNTLTLSGKLHPAEHGELLKFLKNAPAGVQVVDDIQYDDTTVNSGGNVEPSSHPVPTSGHGAIHILTNVIGATAVVTGDYNTRQQCETPCSFSNLYPGSYNLEVRKSGFQPTQTALQVRAGQTLDQKINLEPTAMGLHITSRPAGADVFINGDKQSGQTPLTIPLAPNTYNLVLRLQGYEPHSETIAVKENAQAQVNVELREKSSHIAWAQVDTTPAGATIVVDGVDTGRQSPARVEITAGIHTIALRMDGFQISRRSVEVTEGGTVAVNEKLRPK